MNLRQIIRNWLNSHDKLADCPSGRVEANLDSIQSNAGINFQIHKASGGFVVQCVSYEAMIDRRHINLYIITDNQDLGTEIGKILTLELLKKR